MELREEFWHWEIDSVIGKKKDTAPVVMTIVERKLRMSLWIKVKNHTAEAIDEALAELIPQFGDKYKEIFKSITGDNGSEFTHPYTSFEKGTNECNSRMLRRFIPKGKSIEDYGADDIMYFADKINNLPRKILNYHSPEELFEKQLDLIYAA